MPRDEAGKELWNGSDDASAIVLHLTGEEYDRLIAEGAAPVPTVITIQSGRETVESAAAA